MTDIRQRRKAARYLGALKKAVRSLEQYYQHDLPIIDALTSVSRPNPRFPHRAHYISLSNASQCNFKYVSQEPGKLVFFGETDDGDDICIKFVTQYSKDVHEKCASMGFAPAIKGFDRLPGGWHMVIMDIIGNDYERFDISYRSPALQNVIKEKLIALHQASYVHGDVRDVNVMVKRDGSPEFMLVDFDWAGEIGKARYPMNINRVGISRPDGVHDGEVITADHDMKMVDIMFE